jgi:hypothetical protein
MLLDDMNELKKDPGQGSKEIIDRLIGVSGDRSLMLEILRKGQDKNIIYYIILS